MALTYNAQFDVELRKLVTEEIERITENLSLGTSAKTFDEYQNQVGQLQGLRKTLDLCDEAQTIMSQR